MSDDDFERQFGRPWRPKSAGPKDKRRIDSYDPARYASPRPRLSQETIDQILLISDAWVLNPSERVQLRTELADLMDWFQILKTTQERPAAWEYRDRMKSVRKSMDDALKALGIEADPGVLIQQGVMSRHLNPGILALLQMAAGHEKPSERLAVDAARFAQLVTGAATGIAFLAELATRARAQLSGTSKEADFARIFMASNLAEIYQRISDTAPTATKGGPWFRFLKFVLELAGEHPNNLTDDALKHVWAEARSGRAISP